ncbi:hypothetical protein BJX64DRAFT_175928 [Aspergillus heterothallicus]
MQLSSTSSRLEVVPNHFFPTHCLDPISRKPLISKSARTRRKIIFRCRFEPWQRHRNDIGSCLIERARRGNEETFRKQVLGAVAFRGFNIWRTSNHGTPSELSAAPHKPGALNFCQGMTISHATKHRTVQPSEPHHRKSVILIRALRPSLPHVELAVATAKSWCPNPAVWCGVLSVCGSGNAGLLQTASLWARSLDCLGESNLGTTLQLILPAHRHDCMLRSCQASVTAPLSPRQEGSQRVDEPRDGWMVGLR